MNAITPFSGLSLIIHLLIIACVFVFKLIYKKSGKVLHLPKKVVVMWTQHREKVMPSTSVFIILIITFAVSTSTTVAVKTGIREGARESHIQFITSRYDSVQGVPRNISKYIRSTFFVENNEMQNYALTKYEEDIFRPFVKTDQKKLISNGH